MVYKETIGAQKLAYLKYLYDDKRYTVTEIVKKIGISRATFYRLKRQNFEREKNACETKTNKKMGRPRKLDVRDERQLIRQISRVRTEEGNFSVPRLMQYAGIESKKVTVKTVRRVLNRHKYLYLPCRRKGVMTQKDLRKRVNFAKENLKKRNKEFWTRSVAFYFDGISFYYKRNPLDQARTPTGRNWRKKSEGLIQGCCAKGKKEGSGGKVLKMMVAISQEKGVVFCEQYEKLDGPKFADMVNEHFNAIFVRSGKVTRSFLQDNDPCQNSLAAKRALKNQKIRQIQIPPRSPDLNPIENIFNTVKKMLKREAIDKKIQKESFTEFTERVKRMFYKIPSDLIDKTISSLHERLNKIVACQGQRTKY